MREEFVFGFEKRAAGLASLGKDLSDGIVRNAVRRGNDSLVAMPLTWLSNKLLGKKKTLSGLKSINKHVINADMHAGSVAHSIAKHIPGLRKAFLKKELVPVTLGSKVHNQVERASLVAPIEKINRVATPVIATMAVGNYLDKRKNGNAGTIENGISENAPAQ